MLRGKSPVPDTLSQSQIGGEASSSRLNYTGETRNSSSAEAAWTRRKNTPMWVATEQSTRLVLPGSRNGADYCRSAHRALAAIQCTEGWMRKDQMHLTFSDQNTKAKMLVEESNIQIQSEWYQTRVNFANCELDFLQKTNPAFIQIFKSNKQQTHARVRGNCGVAVL